MRTFEKGDACAFPTKAFYNEAFNYAKSKGVPVQEDLFDEYGGYDSYPNLFFSVLNERIAGTRDLSDKKEITIAQFFEYCDNWEKLNPVELQLTRDYKAVINKDDKTVKVGCQTISFDKINELHKLINAQ